MTENADIIADACKLLAEDIDAARRLLDRDYPFVPSRPIRRRFSKKEAMSVFVRDRFHDRYSGRRLVHPGALRLLAWVLPETFPYHGHGKRDESHIAFWELMPTVDHVVPLALGGRHEAENFATTSMLLNIAKRNASLDELDWTLQDPPQASRWDGLMRWFLRTYESIPSAPEVPMLRGWYRATKAVVSDVRD